MFEASANEASSLHEMIHGEFILRTDACKR